MKTIRENYQEQRSSLPASNAERVKLYFQLMEDVRTYQRAYDQNKNNPARRKACYSDILRTQDKIRAIKYCTTFQDAGLKDLPKK